DRSVDPVKYAGVRAEADANHDGTLGNAILRLLKEVGDEGGDPDTVLCHTDVKLQLIKEVGDQTMHVKAVGSDGKPSATIGYDVLKFMGPNGPVKVVSTVYCPRDTDRKSTRLNSSHVKSSYAVFCLKKQKQTHIQ